MLDEKTQKFRESVQMGTALVIEEAHFTILDAQEEIWFAWVHRLEDPDSTFPIIVRGHSFKECVRLTNTALANLLYQD